MIGIGDWGFGIGARRFRRLNMKAAKPHPTFFTPKMSRAFGIVQALMIILIVGGMLTVTMQYARIGAHHTADSYVKEQAQLWMESSVEWALKEIMRTDSSGGTCWAGGDAPGLTKRNQVYTAHVTVERYYAFEGSCGNVPVVPVGAEESNYYVVLRVEVNATVEGKPTVRLFRRTLQRL